MRINFKTISVIPKKFITNIVKSNTSVSNLPKSLEPSAFDTTSISSNPLNKKELKTFLKEAIEILNTEITDKLGLKNKPILNFKLKTLKEDLNGEFNFLTRQISVPTDILTNPNAIRVYGKKTGDLNH